MALSRSRLALVTAVTVATLTATRTSHADLDTSWQSGILVDVTTGFVPVANDVPIMIGVGVRFAGLHEVYARAGTMPTGDDVGLRFGVVGYHLALRPGRVVRPIFGGLVAGLPQACGHDDAGVRRCEGFPLFVFAATAGLRLEPVRWFGVFAEIALGVDSYPNPFGMVQGGVSFATPGP